MARRHRYRLFAVFAVVVLLVGTVNATAYRSFDVPRAYGTATFVGAVVPFLFFWSVEREFGAGAAGLSRRTLALDGAVFAVAAGLVCATVIHAALLAGFDGGGFTAGPLTVEPVAMARDAVGAMVGYAAGYGAASARHGQGYRSVVAARVEE